MTTLTAPARRGKPPRLPLTTLEAVQLYRELGSVRACAKRTGFSRDVVRHRLAEAGIAVLNNVAATDLYRYLKSLEPEVQMCRWPQCRIPATIGGLCQGHAAAVPEFTNRCAWPGCDAMPFSGGLCGPHTKRAREGTP